MGTALAFLLWEIKQSNLENYILDEVKNNKSQITTNTTDIVIDYSKQTVILYNTSETAKEFLQEFSLDDFICLISE